ncbi:hypothetical protein BV25DRAFT_1799628 [Artomyces pyxidatus]|uniref:Uncharacterized protein n=1 Tax=Artomyces pyxidatus TaxID=48021 RepID=A0ACB8T970_9AGAM|nr:hypothetical protein BV25DRAFT_1799628 [Artomyces pyxidatus]
MATPVKIDASEHPLRSVTVFKSSKAEVVRVFAVALEKGQNKVEIRNLPGTIDTDSARVAGLGDAQLFDVVCAVDGPPPAIGAAPRLRALASLQHRLGQRRAVLLTAGAARERYAESLRGEHVAPAAADAFLETYVERGEATIERVAEIDDELSAVADEIERIVKEEQGRVGSRAGRVSIVLFAREATEAELKLTYIVRDATWVPTYELHHAGGALTLHYRVRVTQRTGEDWTGVALALSTADADPAGQRIPVLVPTRIRPPVAFSGGRRGGLAAASSTADGAADAAAAATVDRPVWGNGASGPANDGDEWDGSAQEFVPAAISEPPAAIVKETPLAVAFSVEGESSVPSDGVAHQVSVAKLPFEANIVRVAVPKAKAVAYLQAKVKNTSEFRLMPGTVSVFVDDSYVSKTYIQDILPGDAFTCTLGADPDTRIRYTRTAKVSTAPASAFSEQFSTTTYTSRVTVQNKHTFALDTLIVRDALPVSDDDKRVSVVLRSPAGLAEAARGEEKEWKDAKGHAHKVRWGDVLGSEGGKKGGLFEWVCKIEPGKEATLEAVWDVRAPADVKWVES